MGGWSDGEFESVVSEDGDPFETKTSHTSHLFVCITYVQRYYAIQLSSNKFIWYKSHLAEKAPLYQSGTCAITVPTLFLPISCPFRSHPNLSTEGGCQ